MAMFSLRHTHRALAVATASVLLATGCGSSDAESDAPSTEGGGDAKSSAIAVGEAKELTFGDATVDMTVDDIRAATDDEIAEYGLTPEADQDLWFVTWSMALTKGKAGALDPEQVYPAADDWVGLTDKGGEVKQTRVMGANFDCTKDGSANEGFSNDEPYVNCLVFQTGPDAKLEAVKAGDRGTWSTQP